MAIVYLPPVGVGPNTSILRFYTLIYILHTVDHPFRVV